MNIKKVLEKEIKKLLNEVDDPDAPPAGAVGYKITPTQTAPANATPVPSAPTAATAPQISTAKPEPITKPESAAKPVTGTGTEADPFILSAENQRDDIAKNKNFFFYKLNGKLFSYNQEEGKPGAEIAELETDSSVQSKPVQAPIANTEQAKAAEQEKKDQIQLPMTGNGISKKYCKVCGVVQDKISQNKDNIIKKLGIQNNQEQINKLFGPRGRLVDGYLGPTTLTLMIKASQGAMNPVNFPMNTKQALIKSLRKACKIDQATLTKINQTLSNPDSIATIIKGLAPTLAESWSVRQKDEYVQNLFERLIKNIRD